MIKVTHKTDKDREIKYKFEKYYFECFEENIIIECDQDNITFDVCNNVEISCKNFCKILGVDNLEISCGNNCYIEVGNNCYIDRCTSNNIIKCGNNCSIFQSDNNTIRAGMTCEIECYNNCTIYARRESKIYCLENCYVEITQESSVYCQDNCYLKIDSENSIVARNSIIFPEGENILSCVNCHIKTNEGLLYCNSFGFYNENKIKPCKISISSIKLNQDFPIKAELTYHIGFGKYILCYMFYDDMENAEQFTEAFKQGNSTKMMMDDNLHIQFNRDVFLNMIYKGI